MTADAIVKVDAIIETLWKVQDDADLSAGVVDAARQAEAGLLRLLEALIADDLRGARPTLPAWMIGRDDRDGDVLIPA